LEIKESTFAFKKVTPLDCNQN